jgi:hypothetical protein
MANRSCTAKLAYKILRRITKSLSRLDGLLLIGFCISLITDGYSTSWQAINIQKFFSLTLFPETPPSSVVLQNCLVEQNKQRPTQSVPVFHLSNSIHVYSFFLFMDPCIAV